MADFCETQRLEKDSDTTPVSTFIYMKKISQALQVQELQEENEALKTKILGLHLAVAEAAERAPNWEKLAQLRSVERERENCEMKEIFTELTSKINTTCTLYNEGSFKFSEMAYRLRTLGEDYETCLRKLLKQLKTTIEKEKLTRKECDNKLKEKEETYKAREKELNEKICKLEQEIKEKTRQDKIPEVLNGKYFTDLSISKCDLINRSPSFIGDDDLSSFASCCNETFEMHTQKTFKYCGKRTSYSMDKALTYRHLRKTKTSIRFTDSENFIDEKRRRKMPK